MELHNDQVPGREVWAVRVENSYGGDDIEWFITAEASSADYRRVTTWWEWPQRHFEDQSVTVTRWYIELPRQRMDWDEVEAWVNFALSSEDLGPLWRRRLDIRRFEAAGVKSE